MDEELRLAKALPSTPWEVRNRTERHGHPQLLKVLKSAHEGTQIIFAVIGLAGVSSHGDGMVGRCPSVLGSQRQTVTAAPHHSRESATAVWQHDVMEPARLAASVRRLILG